MVSFAPGIQQVREVRRIVNYNRRTNWQLEHECTINTEMKYLYHSWNIRRMFPDHRYTDDNP